MNDSIEWMLELNVKEGKGSVALALVQEMVETTKDSEPGTLHYGFYMSPDRSRCTVLERYADSDAVLIHLQNFGSKFADRFFDVFDTSRLAAFGPANDMVRDALDGMGATFDDRIAGYYR